MKIINNNYKIIEKIGEDHFSDIYLIIDLNTNVKKTLVLYNYDKFGNEYKEHFIDNFFYQKKLVFPFVKKTYDIEKVISIDNVNFTGLYYFYTQEYLESIHFKSLKEKKMIFLKGIKKKVVLNKIYNYTNILNYFDIYHEDISINNILINKKLFVYLLDIHNHNENFKQNSFIQEYIPDKYKKDFELNEYLKVFNNEFFQRFSKSYNIIEPIIEELEIFIDNVTSNQKAKVFDFVNLSELYYNIVLNFLKNKFILLNYNVTIISTNENSYSFVKSLIFNLYKDIRLKDIIENDFVLKYFFNEYNDNYNNSELNDKTSIFIAVKTFLEKISYLTNNIIFIDNNLGIDEESKELLNFLIETYNGKGLSIISSNLLNTNDNMHTNKIYMQEKYGLKIISKLLTFFKQKDLSLSKKQLIVKNILNIHNLLDNNNKILYLYDKKIVFNYKLLLSNSLENKKQLIQELISNKYNKDLCKYLLLLDKPIRLDFIKYLFKNKTNQLISKFSEYKILKEVGNNLYDFYNDSVYYLIKNIININYSDNLDRIKNIILLYGDKVDFLNINEMFAYFYYLNIVEDYQTAAEYVYYKIVCKLKFNSYILKPNFGKYLLEIYNKNNGFDFIDNKYAEFLYLILKLKIYNKIDSDYDYIIHEILEFQKNTKTDEYLDNIINLELSIYSVLKGDLESSKEYLFKINSSKMERESHLRYLYYLAFYYYRSRLFQKARTYYRLIIRLILKKNKKYNWMALNSFKLLSFSYILDRDYKRAESYHKKFIKIVKRYSDIYQDLVISAYNNLAYMYSAIGENSKIYDLIKKGAKYAEKKHSYVVLISLYNNIAIYETQFAKRQFYYKKSLELIKVVGDSKKFYLVFSNYVNDLIYFNKFDRISKVFKKYDYIGFDKILKSKNNLHAKLAHLISILPYMILFKDGFNNIYDDLCKLQKESLSDHYIKMVSLLILIIDIIKNDSLGDVDLINKLKEFNFETFDIETKKTIITVLMPYIIEEKGLFTNYLNDISIMFKLLYYLKYTDKFKNINFFHRIINTNGFENQSNIYSNFLMNYSLILFIKNSDSDNYLSKKYYSIVNKNLIDYQNNIFTSYNNFYNILIDEFKTIQKKIDLNSKEVKLNSIIKCIKYSYEKDNKGFIKNILKSLLTDLNFDRGILFLKKDSEYYESERIYKNKLFYFENDIIDCEDIVINNNIYISEFDSSCYFDITQYITIPLLDLVKLKRYFQFNNNNYLNYELEKCINGFIYLDRKDFIELEINFNTLEMFKYYFIKYMENKELEEKYMKDGLTKMYLREVFFNKVREHIYEKKNFKTFSLLMIDIDDFKSINDTYGHQKGDFVLENVSKIILNSLRNSDIVGRYGGEEFIVALFDSENTKVKNIAERIRTNIQESKLLGSLRELTVSIGGAFYPYDGTLLEELIAKTDKRLYKAKNNGKNRIEMTDSIF